MHLFHLLAHFKLWNVSKNGVSTEKMAKYFCYTARTKAKIWIYRVSISESEHQTKKVNKLGKGEVVEDQGNGCNKLPWIRGKGSNWQGIKVSQKLLNCQKTPEEIVSVNSFRVEYFGVLSSLQALILRFFQDNKFSNCAVLQLPLDLSFFYFWCRVGKKWTVMCVCISSERPEISWEYLGRTLFLFMSYTEKECPFLVGPTLLGFCFCVVFFPSPWNTSFLQQAWCSSLWAQNGIKVFSKWGSQLQPTIGK